MRFRLPHDFAWSRGAGFDTSFMVRKWPNVPLEKKTNVKFFFVFFSLLVFLILQAPAMHLGSLVDLGWCCIPTVAHCLP